MAQGSPVFPEFPLRLSLFSCRTCRGLWRPAALPYFLWSPRPLPPLPCSSSSRLPRSALSWGPAPGGSLGGWTSSPGLLCLLQAACRAFWAHGPGPVFPLFTDSPFRLPLSSAWALTPGRSHGLGLTHLGSQAPWPLFSGKHCSSLSILLPCGLPAVGADREIQKLSHDTARSG